MGPLALIIVFELILTTSILGLSSHPRVFNNTKHQISNVLGVQQIAQVEDGVDNPSPAADNSTSSQPTVTTAPTEPDGTQPVQITATPAPSGTTNSAETPAPAVPEVSPTASPIDKSSSEQTNPSAMPQSSEEPLSSSIPTRSESSTSQTQAVLNPDELINSLDNINSQSITEAKKEEDQLSQAQDPKEQTKLLVTFATDKVKDMSNFTKSDDFTSANFAAQRFNSQMDQAISNLDKLPKKDQAPLRQQLSNFCDQADSVLRTVELSVPEESEQDIQIARGQCQELKL